MTTETAGLERKVQQVDNDVQSIYVMLAGIQGTQERHTNRLNELAARLDAVNDIVAGRLQASEHRLSGRVDSIESRLDGVESRLDEVLDLLRGRRD